MIQKDLNLSNNKVLKMAENIRVSTGSRKIIEKDIKGKLRKLNHTLEDLFKTEKCTFVFENKAEKIKKMLNNMSFFVRIQFNQQHDRRAKFK